MPGDLNRMHTEWLFMDGEISDDFFSSFFVNLHYLNVCNAHVISLKIENQLFLKLKRKYLKGT